MLKYAMAAEGVLIKELEDMEYKYNTSEIEIVYYKIHIKVLYYVLKLF